MKRRPPGDGRGRGHSVAGAQGMGEDVLKVDADGIGGDDTADCLRYLVATKSQVVTQLLPSHCTVDRSWWFFC